MSIQEVMADVETWPEPLGVYIVIGGSHGLGAKVADAIEAAEGKVIVFDSGGPRHPGVTFFEVDFHTVVSVQEATQLALADFGIIDGVIAVASDDGDLTAVATVAKATTESLSKVDGKVVIIDSGAVGAETLVKEIAFESQNHIRASIVDAGTSTLTKDVVEALTI